MGPHSVSTVVSAPGARSAVGQKYASTVVCAQSARSAAGVESASTAVSAIIARSAMGTEYARTVVSVIRARSVVVHKQTLVLAKNSQIKNEFNHYTKGRRRPRCGPPDPSAGAASRPGIVPSGNIIDAPVIDAPAGTPITSQCMPPPPLAVLSPCVLCRSVSAHEHLTFLTLLNTGTVLWPPLIPDDNAGS